MDHVLNWLWQGSAIALATFAALRLLDRSRARVSLHPLRHRAAGRPGAAARVAALDRTPAWEAIADTPMSATPVLAIPVAWWTSGAVIAGLWALWCAGQRGARDRVVCRCPAGTTRVADISAALESRLTFWNGDAQPRAPDAPGPFSGVPTAAVLGWGSPVIAVSPAFVRRLDDDELDRVVIHEWAHVQRNDDRLEHPSRGRPRHRRLAPGVWWLERQLRVEREVACDEMAVAVTGNPKRYAARLTTMATLGPNRRHPASALGALSSPTLRATILRILSANTLATRNGRRPASRGRHPAGCLRARSQVSAGRARDDATARRSSFIAVPDRRSRSRRPAGRGSGAILTSIEDGEPPTPQPSGAPCRRPKPVPQLPLVADRPRIHLPRCPLPRKSSPRKSVKEERPPDDLAGRHRSRARSTPRCVARHRQAH